MTVSLHGNSSNAAAGTERDARAALPLPNWVSAYVDPGTQRTLTRTTSYHLELASAGEYSLATARVADAAQLPPLHLQRHTIDAYRGIADGLRESAAPHPIRFWNFVPHIRSSAGDGLDRYMVFNAGRYAAYLDWYGDTTAFDTRVATATGIGHEAPDLVIHVLAAARPGVHVMNPRQRAPRCYSRCYGPFPPCFARATVVVDPAGRGTRVLVGGTAAVCGEQSLHPNDVHRQADETFRNLAKVVEAARAHPGAPHGAGTSPAGDPLRLFRSLRVYYVHDRDEPLLVELVARRFPHLAEVEFLRADICRPELLVEIEGTAEIEGVPA